MNTIKLLIGLFLVFLYSGCGQDSKTGSTPNFEEFKTQFPNLAPIVEFELMSGKQLDSLASLPFLTKVFPDPLEEEYTVGYNGIGRLDNPNGISSILIRAIYVGPMSEDEYHLINFDKKGSILGQSVIATTNNCTHELKGKFSGSSCLTITKEVEIGCMEDGFKTYIQTDTSYFGISPEGKIEKLDAPCLK